MIGWVRQKSCRRLWITALAAAITGAVYIGAAAAWVVCAGAEAVYAADVTVEKPQPPVPVGSPVPADEPLSQAASLAPLDMLERQIGLLDTGTMEKALASLGDELKEEMPDFDLRRIVQGGVGERFGFAQMINRLLRYLVREVALNSHLLGQLVVLAVFCAILRNLAAAFPMQGAADVAFAIAFLALLYLSLQSFRAAVDVAAGTISTMVTMMQATLPLMTTMLAAVGAVTTATVFHPMFVTVIHVVATVVNNVLLPLVFLSAVLGVLGTLSKDFPMKKLAGLARQWTLTILGLLFILFFGVLSIRGAIAPVADGIGLKTAKFLTGTFVPVVGARMAEALEVVVGGSMLLKNAIGVFGMAAVFVIVAFPVIKVFTVLLIYRIATALVEPVSDERLVDAMSTMANSLTLVLACMLTVGLMFFVGITVLVGLGNVTAFIR